MLSERLEFSKPLHERVYGVVRNAITTRELEPGAVVNESLLAKTLGVSRSPIRDAMQALFREGLVVRGSNGRYYVARLSREDLDGIYAVRAALEGLAAYLVCQDVADADIEALEDILRREKRAAELHDASGLLEAGTAFHEWIIVRAGNPVLSELTLMLRGRTRPFTLESSRLRSREIDAVREHEEFIEALRRRDARRARDLMEHHLEQSRFRLLRALEAVPDRTS